MLIATEVGATQAVSSATVRVVPTEAQGSFAMGEEIPQVGRIAEIERGWIDVVDRGGRHARLSLAETRSRDHAATAGPGAATPAAAAPFADRVRQVDDHTWEVDRGLVKDMVAGVTKPGAVRALPMVVDGEVKGIKLMNVTAGSLPTVFGLKSGDVLTTLDGAPLKTANQVLELYAKLDAVTGVQIGVTRGGAPVEIDLQLK